MIDENTYHFLELCELNSLPDKELVKKGLKRDEIVEELYLYGDYSFDGGLKSVANMGFKKVLQKSIYSGNTEKATEIYKLIDKMEGNDTYINSLKAINKLFLLAQKKRSSISPTELDKAILKELRNRIVDLCCQNESYFARFKAKPVKPKIKSKASYETLTYMNSEFVSNLTFSDISADLVSIAYRPAARRRQTSAWDTSGEIF